MHTLSSLLVQDQVLSAAQLEKVLQRQVVLGGDITTAILELKLVAEDRLTQYAAQACSLLPLDHPDRVELDPRLVHRLSAAQAVDWGTVPIARTDDGVVVATSADPGEDAARGLATALGAPARFRYVLPFRLALLLDAAYGVPLDGRFSTLQKKIAPSHRSGPLPAPEDADTGQDPKADAPSAEPQVVVESEQGDPRERTRKIFRTLTAAPVAQRVDAPVVPERPAASISAPLRYSEAKRLLAEAKDRDTIIELFFRFAHQAFEFSLLAAVLGDTAVGKLAAVRGKPFVDASDVEIPLEEDNLFSRAVRESHYQIGSMDTPSAVAVLNQLGRDVPLNAAVIPVLLKRRVILLLYGESGHLGVKINRITKIAEFAELVGASFERILLARKYEKYAAATAHSDSGSERFDRTANLKVEASVVPPRRDLSQWVAPATASSQIPEAAAPDTAQPPRESASQAPTAPVETDGARPDEESATAAQPHPETPTAPRPSQQAPEEPVDTAPPPSQESEETVDTTQPLYPVAAPPANLGAPGAPAAHSQTPRSAVSVIHPVHLRGDATGTLRPGQSTPPPAASSRPTPQPPQSPDAEKTRDGDAPSDGNQTKGAVRQRTLPDAGLYLRVEKNRPSRPPAPQRRPSAPPRREEPAPRREPTQKMVSPEPVPLTQKRHSTAAYAAPVTGAEPKDTAGAPIPLTPSDDANAARLRQIVDQLLAGHYDPQAVAALAQAGEKGIGLLIAHFPGPLLCDRYQEMGRLPPVAEHGPLLRALVAMGDAVVPYVLALLDSFDSEIRFYATFLFSEIGGADVLPVVVGRVFDNDRQIRQITTDILRRFAGTKEYYQAVSTITSVLTATSSTLEKKRTAAEVLGTLREPTAIAPLATMLGSVDAVLAERCRRALVRITFTDLGFSERRWLQWYEANRATHPIEWAIEGINHKNEDIRRSAIAAVKEAIGHYIEWPPPPYDFRQRKELYNRARSYWNAEGRHRFSAPQ